MGMMTQFLERLGFVRLRDYGLTLTPDRRVVPMDVALPPEPVLFVAPPPEPIRVAPVPAPMCAAEPDDDWDWEIAVARARATAEPPPVPLVAPPAPVAAPSVRAVSPPVAAPSLRVVSPPPPPSNPPTEQRTRTIIAVPTLPSVDPQALRHYDGATRRGLPAPRRFPRATNHGLARNGSSRH
jgi:hypothetical protein